MVMLLASMVPVVLPVKGVELTDDPESWCGEGSSPRCSGLNHYLAVMHAILES